MKIGLYYKGEPIMVELSCLNTHIEDSYRFKSRTDMKEILTAIRTRSFSADYAVNKLSLKRQIREWRAHNLLYSLGIARKRTKDVDLNENKWYVKVAYGILSLMYWRI